jgi:hypothetical protein
MRLNNGNPLVLAAVKAYTAMPRRWESATCNNDGTAGSETPQVDICATCWAMGQIRYVVPSNATDVAHPPYADGLYGCAICGIKLTEEDEDHDSKKG